jgi:hypothetical protein
MKSSELFGRIRTAEHVQREVSLLIDAWCDRRCLNALREILSGWPIVGGLTDDWGRGLAALRGARAVRDEITDAEADVLADAIRFVEDALER